MNQANIMRVRFNQLANSGLNFAASKEDMDLVLIIVGRIIGKWGPSVAPKLLAMEITACHLNGCKLDLQALSQADDFNLQHDVFGIRRHLDRDTGKLKDCFLPRFAMAETNAESAVN